MTKSQEWATRVVHEASLHKQNCFVTLTYADEHLPPDYSVSVRPLQLFMKRLRKKLGHSRVRFFACGEYGDANYRPHYHLVLFGYDPDDKVHYATQNGYPRYASNILSDLWPYGLVDVGSVTKQSAAYVARYALKKVTGEKAPSHYSRVNPVTGELVHVRPEFLVMSRRPGIGAEWLRRYDMDVFPSDFLVIDGRKVSVPRYYQKRLSNPDALTAVPTKVAAARAKRNLNPKIAANNTPERLAVREEVLNSKLNRLKREL